MCQAVSGIAMWVGNNFKVFTLPGEDSHSAIREHYNIRDNGGPGSQRQTPVELIPVRGLLSADDMDFVFDDKQPDWWSCELTEIAIKKLFKAWRDRWELWGQRLHSDGDLYLRSLTSIPEGVTLSAGRGLDLSSLTSIPEGVTLSAGRGLDLSSLTSIPEGVTLSAGGYLDLNSLTSIPEGVTLSAGGDLDLSSLTSIPEGVTLSAGRDLYLRSLTSIPEGVTLSAGRGLDLRSLTSIPEGVAVKAERVLLN